MRPKDLSLIQVFRASPLQHDRRLSREDVEQAQFPLAWLVRLPPVRRNHSALTAKAGNHPGPRPVRLTALAEMSSRRE
jgi:hypothetical protein